MGHIPDLLTPKGWIKLDQDTNAEFSIDSVTTAIKESEERFRLLSEATFEAIIIHDNGVIRLVNHSFTREFGLEPDEAVGMKVSDLVTEESKPLIFKNIRSIDEELYSVTAVSKDGSTFPAQVHSRIIRFDSHAFRVAAIRNLTSYYKAEEALHRIEKRLIQLIEGLPIAVLLVDVDGVPRYANGVFNKLFQVGARNIGRDSKGGRLAEACHMYMTGTGELYPYNELPTILALSGEHVTIDDMEIMSGNNRIPVEVSAAPVRDDENEITYSVTVFVDITRRRKAEKSLREAEEKYRSIFENAAFGIFQSTPDGKYVTVNESMARLWRYESPEEMVKSVDDIARLYVEPARREVFKRELSVHNIVQDFEARVRRKDDSIMWISVTARSVRDTDDIVTYYEGTIKDITESKKAQESLRESEERYRTLVETSPDAVALLSTNFDLLTVSRQMVSEFGYDNEEEMIGLNAGKLVAREDLAWATENAMKVIESGSIKSYIINMLKKDGAPFPVEVSASAIMDANGKPSSLVVIARDITQRKKDEEMLQKTNAELEGYAHTVSHDLEGPISAIILASDTLRLLLDLPSSEKVKNDIRDISDTIGKNAKRASGLIRGLLDLAEAGQKPRIISKVNVTEIVKSIQKERTSQIIEKGITVNIADDLGTLMASPVHIYELFSNLISNAIKNVGGPYPVIEIERIPEADPHIHTFLLRDNGDGIPSNIIDKIFMPFTKGTTGQTGIGLAIVDKIVKVHDGKIEAYNDNGACFKFSLKDLKPEIMNEDID